jgi:hypothetical protein
MGWLTRLTKLVGVILETADIFPSGSVRGSFWVIPPFSLCARQSTADVGAIERGTRDKEALSELGTIVIKVVRIQNLRASNAENVHLLPKLKDEVDEKAKKALCTLSVKYPFVLIISFANAETWPTSLENGSKLLAFR